MSDKIGKYNVSETDNGELIVRSESMSNKVVKPSETSLIVNGVWYLDAYPNSAIVELQDGSLAKFRITPFRQITDKDMTVYKGYHPRKCKGQPLPGYLYKFYGLQKNEESLSEVVRTRISPTEKSNLEAYAKNNDKTPSEVIRDFIRSL